MGRAGQIQCRHLMTDAFLWRADHRDDLGVGEQDVVQSLD